MKKDYMEEFERVEKVIEIFEIRHPEYQNEILHLKTHNFNVRSIKVGRQTTNFGLCKYTHDYFGFNHKAIYGATITFNKRLLDEDNNEKLKNTIIHEIFHAIAENINGERQGHKGFWKELANIYNETFPNEMPVTRCGDWNGVKQERNTTPYRYAVVCPECGATTYYKIKGKVIKNIENYRCKECGCDDLYVEKLN